MSYVMQRKLLFAVLFALAVSVSGSPSKRYRHGYHSTAERRWLSVEKQTDEGKTDVDMLDSPRSQNHVDSTEDKSYETCTSNACVLRAQSLKLTMNTIADPCDDFYEYACGGWSTFWEAYVPSKQIDADLFEISNTILKTQIRNILTEDIQPDDIGPVRSAKILHQSCVNAEVSIDSPRLQVIGKILDQNGGWPMAQEKENSKIFEWQNMDNKFGVAYRTAAFYGIDVIVSGENDDDPLITISKPKTVLSSSMIANETALQEYQQKIIDTAEFFVKAGKRNVLRSQISDDAADVVEFEKKLLKILSSSTSEDTMYLMSIDQLQRKYHNHQSHNHTSKINWLKTIQYRFLDSKINIQGDKKIEMAESVVKYLPELAHLLDQTSSRTIVNYVYWDMIGGVSSSVGEYIDNMAANNVTRWYNCVLKNPMSMAISYAFANRSYVSESKIKETADLISKVQKKVYQRISQVTWMSHAMKKTALAKILNMKKHISFDDFNITKDATIAYYKGLAMTDDYCQNIVNWIEWKNRKSLLKEGLSFQIEGLAHHVEVNAFYVPTLNAMYIPPWMIKFSTIGADVPEAVSLGTLGAVIGHEISHGFDDDGIDYDEDGDFVFWKQDARKSFSDRAECFIEQYNNYTIPGLLNFTSNELVHVSGARTLGENMADVAGLNASFAVLKSDMKKGDFKDLRLPGLEHFTADQLFFLSLGNLWCAQMTNDTLNMLHTRDPHATRHARINGIVSNSVGFDEAFNCPLGSKMNPEKKCNMWN